MGLLNTLRGKYELYRLEQRYTRRDKRTTFASNAIYVDGEYIYNDGPPPLNPGEGVHGEDVPADLYPAGGPSNWEDEVSAQSQSQSQSQQQRGVNEGMVRPVERADKVRRTDSGPARSESGSSVATVSSGKSRISAAGGDKAQWGTKLPTNPWASR